MPNWTENQIFISHENPAQIERVKDAKGELFQEFIPCPQELLDGEGWYDWRVKHWGTKWDVNLGDICLPDSTTLYATFESAWSPPLEAYDKLVSMGFDITAYYYEYGIGFAGKYENGTRYHVNDDDFRNANWRDGLPQDLTEFLESKYYAWQEIQDEMAE